MKNKPFLWFAMFFLTYLIASVVFQYLIDRTINPIHLFGGALGIILAFLISTLSNKHSLFLWVATGLAIITMPIILVSFTTIITSFFAIQLPKEIIFAVYILGVFIISFFFIKRGIKWFFREPTMDERNVLHLAWSGILAYFFLSLLLIGAILQPWIPLNQLSLWIGILTVSFLFWFISLVILEKVK